MRHSYTLTLDIGPDVVDNGVLVRLRDVVLVKIGAARKDRVQAVVEALGAGVDLGLADKHGDGTGDLLQLLDRVLGGLDRGGVRLLLELEEDDVNDFCS